jgi:hypothetical protein
MKTNCVRFSLLASAMRGASSLCLVVPLTGLGQTSFPTEFPPESTAFTAEALKERLTGKVFMTKPIAGAGFRIDYKETYVFFNQGTFSDSGKWRTEGSSVCIDWQKIRASCSEARAVGEKLYMKRANNGEIILMEVQ